MDRRPDGQMDRWTDVQMDRRPDGHTNSIQNESPHYPIRVRLKIFLYPIFSTSSLRSLTPFSSDKNFCSDLPQRKQLEELRQVSICKKIKEQLPRCDVRPDGGHAPCALTASSVAVGLNNKIKPFQSYRKLFFSKFIKCHKTSEKMWV